MNFNTFAIRGTVPFGEVETEGYLLPQSLWTKSNKYGLSKTQAVLLAYPKLDRNQAAKQYARITRIHTVLPPSQKEEKQARNALAAKLNLHPQVRVEADGRDAYVVDLIPADQLVTFLKLAKKYGSRAADSLIDDLAGLSVQQIFVDAFNVKMEVIERQDYAEKNFTWYDKRDDAKIAHPWFQEACKRHNYPADRVHDLMTLGLFGDTAEMARKKPLVDEALDPIIGLNHQECSVKMALLARAKRLFAGYRKGTWQERKEKESG